MPTSLRALLLAVLFTLAPVGAGVLLAGGPAPTAAPPPAYTGTDLDGFDTTATAIARAGFCSRVVTEAVTEALGGEAANAGVHVNGDRLAVAGERDVVHEYGCRFRGAGARAEAWVFAPPVTTARARELTKGPAESLAEGTAGEGCRRLDDAPAFGAPGGAVLCPDGKPSLTYAGLIGDAWLTCRLTLPAGTPVAELRTRAGRWCVAVVRAAAVA
ncbi:hypothetical protein [Nocardioides sp. YIM 152588]|uniref:hypothetical protein n=1 Tax=Nocardioides sp. YIM 152588 TaxID=3158259 RepID=UPI0032E36EAD